LPQYNRREERSRLRGVSALTRKDIEVPEKRVTRQQQRQRRRQYPHKLIVTDALDSTSRSFAPFVTFFVAEIDGGTLLSVSGETLDNRILLKAVSSAAGRIDVVVRPEAVIRVSDRASRSGRGMIPSRHVTPEYAVAGGPRSVVSVRDFELLISKRSGAPGEIRTPDPLLRRQMLYPAELRAPDRF
jgi:hypothetical protein